MAEHKRRIYQVSQHSSDLDQTIVFYTEILRGRFIARFDPPGIAFIDFDGVRVIFSSNDEEMGPPFTTRSTISRRRRKRFAPRG